MPLKSAFLMKIIGTITDLIDRSKFLYQTHFYRLLMHKIKQPPDLLQI